MRNSGIVAEAAFSVDFPGIDSRIEAACDGRTRWVHVRVLG
jgi:hypothetical protein